MAELSIAPFRMPASRPFLEAHERGFAYFGGVFEKLRYDNLTSAVKRILRGHQREDTMRFIAFRSHWGFESEFCTPGEGHEKGGVEGEGGYFRRNHSVPVPKVASWEELDVLLWECSRNDEQRIIGERTEIVDAGMVLEREHLRPLKEGLRFGSLSLSKGEREPLCESAHQLLFRSSTGRSGSAGQGALRLRADLAPGRMCGGWLLFSKSDASVHDDHFAGDVKA